MNMGMKSVSLARLIDLSLFGILFASVLLYQLQLAVDLIADYRVREILYGLLYLRIAFFYRVRMTPNLLLILLFLTYSLFVAVHTYVYTYSVYGSDLAVQGFLRFVGVALLAPLASILFTSVRQVESFIYIWLGVIVAGAATAVYQFLGGELTWLTQDYLAVRGSVIRFKTLLGEPNVGGMAAVVTYIVAVLGIRNWFWKSFLLLVAFTLVVSSVSKAAVAGCVLATVVVLFNFRRALNARDLQRLMLIGILVAVAMLSIFVFNTEIRYQSEAYVNAGVEAFYGADVDDKGFMEDLSDRLVGRTIQGIENARRMSDFYLLDIFLGSGFGAAGSAAFELSGSDFASSSGSLLPHNSLSEIYLTGGIFMLAIFLAIVVRTLHELWTIRGEDRIHRAMLGAFIVFTAFIVGYPIIYQPVLGAFFWLTVGYAANYRTTAWIKNPSRGIGDPSSASSTRTSVRGSNDQQ